MKNTGPTQEAISHEQTTPSARRNVALLIREVPVRRLLEAILAGLDLESSQVAEAEFNQTELSRYEMVIADADIARRLRPTVNTLQLTGEQVKPALVGVGSTELASLDPQNGDFDAVLVIPASTADLTSRLSVVLYSHRALAQRYRSALEELNFNRNIVRSVTNGISRFQRAATRHAPDVCESLL